MVTLQEIAAETVRAICGRQEYVETIMIHNRIHDYEKS
jgi:hypothetical protein